MPFHRKAWVLSRFTPEPQHFLNNPPFLLSETNSTCFHLLFLQSLARLSPASAFSLSSVSPPVIQPCCHLPRFSSDRVVSLSPLGSTLSYWSSFGWWQELFCYWGTFSLCQRRNSPGAKWLTPNRMHCSRPCKLVAWEDLCNIQLESHLFAFQIAFYICSI